MILNRVWPLICFSCCRSGFLFVFFHSSWSFFGLVFVLFLLLLFKAETCSLDASSLDASVALTAEPRSVQSADCLGTDGLQPVADQRAGGWLPYARGTVPVRHFPSHRRTFFPLAFDLRRTTN